jgi:hypothetical protein
MHRLTTDLIGDVCRIFLRLAYPGDDNAVPVKKRCFLNLPAEQPMLTYMTTDAAIHESCQVQHDKDGNVNTLLARLGCCHYPHLKLQAKLIDQARGGIWLFSVDTHDAFSKTCFLPPPGHPDAAAWKQIQAQNVALKERIEAAWEQAGVATFNGLLRRDLDGSGPSPS